MAPFFQGQGLFIAGVTHISGREVLAAVERGAAIVDVREEYEVVMKTFDVPGVIYLPTSTFKDSYQELPRGRPLILADAVGLRSKDAVLFLLEKGWADVANLNGGILDWEKEGMPTKVNPEELWVGDCACSLKPRKALRGKG
ncbi:MAG: rhodanese-like domain-containing protein [Myxococcales bacterium]